MFNIGLHKNLKDIILSDISSFVTDATCSLYYKTYTHTHTPPHTHTNTNTIMYLQFNQA